jgi:hypothetical protein
MTRFPATHRNRSERIIVTGAWFTQTPSDRHAPHPFASRPRASSASLPLSATYRAPAAPSAAKMRGRSLVWANLNAALPDRLEAGAVRAATEWACQAARSSSKNGRSGSGVFGPANRAWSQLW